MARCIKKVVALDLKQFMHCGMCSCLLLKFFNNLWNFGSLDLVQVVNIKREGNKGRPAHMVERLYLEKVYKTRGLVYNIIYYNAAPQAIDS